jgi:hypothetical protein
MLIALVDWLVRGRKNYRGPTREIAGDVEAKGPSASAHEVLNVEMR